MSPRNLLWFYRRRMRARAIQELLAVVGIAVGVALLFAVQVSNRSLSASISQLTHGLVGRAQLQVVARGPHGFDQRLLREVDRIDGVRAAAPMLQMPVNLVGPRGARSATLLAADPRLARLGGTLLQGYVAGRLAGLHAGVLPAPVSDALGVHFGESITVEVHGRTATVPVGAVVGRGDVGVLADVPAIVVPLAYGQEISGMQGRVSRIAVDADPRRLGAVERALRQVTSGHVDVRGTDADARVFDQAAMPSNQSTALFAGIAAMVGFLFAFNAMLLMARERRRLIAELRMSGYGIWPVVEVIMFDALVLGILASGVGLALGELLSSFVFHPSPGYLGIAFPVGTARIVDLWTVAMALAVGTLAAMLASLAPLVAAFRAPAMDAVETGAGGGEAMGSLRRGVLVGVATTCLLGAVAILFAAPSAAIVGVVALIASMLLVLPVALVSLLRLADRQRRRIASVVPAIAIGELLSARTRSVAIAAIAAIAVFGSTAIEGAHHDLQRGLDPNARELNAVADLWITPEGASNTLATVPFAAGDAIARLTLVPQVAAVQVYRGSFFDIGNRRVWVIAPPRQSARPFPPSQLVEGDLGTAVQRLQAGGWAVASEAVAEQEGLRLGESFTLAAPVPTRLRLAAITTNLAWSPGTLVLNADDYERAWGSDEASALLVDLDAGVTPAEGARAVRAGLGASGLAVQTAHARELRDRSTIRDGLSRLTQIASLMLIAAALAMAAAMAGMVWQRRRRLADLKLAGIGQSQLWRALLLESILLLGVGCVIGTLYGLVGEQLLDRALKATTGFPVDNTVGVLIALASLAVVFAVACAVATVPGYLAARVPVDVAFRD